MFDPKKEKAEEYHLNSFQIQGNPCNSKNSKTLEKYGVKKSVKLKVSKSLGFSREFRQTEDKIFLEIIIQVEVQIRENFKLLSLTHFL